MDIVYSSGAIEDIRDFPEDVREEVKHKIEELRSSPTSHEDLKLIRIGGREVYRLEIKDSRSAKLDHRVVFDYEEDAVRIYSVIDRDEGYDGEKISDRL